MNRVPEILGLLILACTVSACGGGDNGTNQNPVVYDYQLPSDRSDGWAIGSLADVAIDQARIEQVTRQIIGGTYTGIDSFVIVRNGQLVHDVYFGDFNAARRHDLRSATKSITSMLVGIAIDQGYIGNADEPALDYITAYSNLRNWDDRKNDIAVKHFLTMTPGLACDDQDRSSPGNEAEMYPSNDWVRFVLDLPMLDDPGSNWAYCTAGVVALGAVLLEATGMPADDFSDLNLFEPLGIDNYNWEYSPSGQVDTGGHIHMLPRDMAKLGELMLNRGDWNGRSVLSDNWIGVSTASFVALSPSVDYGYLWWRQDFGAAAQYPTYYADGNGGQYIFVVPDADLVIVFTGSNYNSALSNQPFEIMEQYVIPALQ